MKIIKGVKEEKQYKYTNEFNGNISRSEIKKETDKVIVLKNGVKCLKETSCSIYADTPEEVYTWLLKKKQEKMISTKDTYQFYKKDYLSFKEKGMVCSF